MTENKRPKWEFNTHKECELHPLNKDSKYTPCHKGIDEPNCLLCFCPLFNLECPGDPRTLPNGIRDCSYCTYPHHRENYSNVIALLADSMKKKDLP